MTSLLWLCLVEETGEREGSFCCPEEGGLALGRTGFFPLEHVGCLSPPCTMGAQVLFVPSPPARNFWREDLGEIMSGPKPHLAQGLACMAAYLALGLSIISSLVPHWEVPPIFLCPRRKNSIAWVWETREFWGPPECRKQEKLSSLGRHTPTFCPGGREHFPTAAQVERDC